MLLSVIIPVYNVEKYVEKCVNSIKKQNSSDIEIIIVDDGSIDNSGALCENLKSKNIIVKHKKNGGLSDARNYGLKYASGEYVWFVDSDDYIEDGSIKKIVNALKKESPDLLVIQSKIIDDFGKIKDECKYTIKNGLYNVEEYLKQMKKNPRSILLCAQYHIVKKEIIECNKLYFKKNIIHEDELWTPQVIINSNKILYSNYNIYFHYMRLDSIMHSSKREKSGRSDLIVAEELFKIFDQYSDLDLSYLKDRCTNIFLQAVWKVQEFSKVNTIKRTTPIKNSLYIKTKLKSFIYLISPKLYMIIHKCKEI